MVKRLLMVAVIIKGEKAQVATDAADLLQRLAGQVAEAERRYKGVYSQWSLTALLCDKNRDRAETAEALLREAGEVMRDVTERSMFSSKDRIVEHIRTFVTKLEKTYETQ